MTKKLHELIQAAINGKKFKACNNMFPLNVYTEEFFLKEAAFGRLSIMSDWTYEEVREPIKLEFKNVQVTHDGLRDGREALSFTFPIIPEVLEDKRFNVTMTEVIDDPRS